MAVIPFPSRPSKHLGKKRGRPAVDLEWSPRCSSVFIPSQAEGSGEMPRYYGSRVAIGRPRCDGFVFPTDPRFDEWLMATYPGVFRDRRNLRVTEPARSGVVRMSEDVILFRPSAALSSAAQRVFLQRSNLGGANWTVVEILESLAYCIILLGRKPDRSAVGGWARNRRIPEVRFLISQWGTVDRAIDSAMQLAHSIYSFAMEAAAPDAK